MMILFRQWQLLLSSLCAVAVFCAPDCVEAGSGQPLEDVQVQVLPVTVTTTILDSTLWDHDDPAATWTVSAFSPPSHGRLVREAVGFSYQPSATFWSAGTDSFTYTAMSSSFGEPPATASVLLTAAAPAEALSAEDFESGAPASEWSLFGGAYVTQVGAHGGLWGLTLLPGVLSYASLDVFQLVLSLRGDGEGGAGRGAEMTVTPPGGGWQGSPTAAKAILTAAQVGNPGGAKVKLMASFSNPYTIFGAIWDSAKQTFVQTPAVSLGVDHAVRIAVHWWPESAFFDGGLLLRVDGELVGWITGVDTSDWGDLGEVTYGFSAAPAPTTWTVDNLVAWSPAAEGTSLMERLFNDGFESGALLAWPEASGSSAQVTVASAIDGDWGLEIDPGAVEPYLTRTLASPSDDYRARFRIETGSLFLGNDSGVTLLQGFDAAGQELLSLTVIETSGEGNRLELAVLHQGSMVMLPDSVAIPAGLHTIALDWWAAIGGAAHNGAARLWLDGELVSELSNLYNHGHQLASIRFGAGTSTGMTVGELVLDDFESWRQAP